MDDAQHQLFSAAFEKFLHYSTSLFVVNETAGEHPYAYGGSGTFVLVGEHPCLPTAGHVWNLILRRYDQLLFSTGGSATSLRIKRDTLKVLHCSPTLTQDEERGGPDLALVELSEEHVERLKALGKSFYNLAARRTAARLSIPSTGQFRALIGTPGEWVNWEPPTQSNRVSAQVGTSLLVSRIHAVRESDPWDYLDLSIHDRRGDNFPASYCGMSGAGLWRIGVEGGQQLTWDGTAFLDGVAFYWDASGPPDAEVLRSHGPHSIYEVLPSLL